jgi:Fic family protein
MARMAYIPAFTRYSPSVTAAFGRIERARGVIESAEILPAQEEILRVDARVGSVHYSNVMEGNELSRLEALRAVEHELEPDDRARLELVNYVAALDFIADAHATGGIRYSPAFLQRLHGVLTEGLGRADSRFKPQHEGRWRDGTVVVGDPVAIYHVAPEPERVPALMSARLDWLEARRANPDFPTPILAGVAHFEIAEVHPFADYNGRTARLFATAVFDREGFLSRSLFSPERYYAVDKDAYYSALRAIKRTNNLNDWLGYYVDGLAVEFERVAEKVKALVAVTRALPLPLQLTGTQDRAIAMLTTDRRRTITIAELTEATGVSARTASRDLNALVSAGVLRAAGTTRDRRFRLAARGSAVGRPRTWSEHKIESQLRRFCERLGRWPTYADFERERLLPLYAAMQRAGGAEHWAERLEPAQTPSATSE